MNWQLLDGPYNGILKKTIVHFLKFDKRGKFTSNAGSSMSTEVCPCVYTWLPLAHVVPFYGLKKDIMSS